MTDAWFTSLDDRGLVSVSGEDAESFLQGLVTNDVSTVSDGSAIYAALLTPQGRYLHDFFILRLDGTLYLECDEARIDDLVRRLSRYRLRAKVAIENASAGFGLFALFGDNALERFGLAAGEGTAAGFANGLVFVDPRNAALGARAVLPGKGGDEALRAAGLAPGRRDSYDVLRLTLGIAAGDPEIEPEKSFPMDYGLDELHGVSFTKGCYIGQEVTARMKARGLVRKRLVPVRIEGGTPEAGTEILAGGKSAGELRAARGTTGLALVRIDALEQALAGDTPFEAGDSTLYPLPSATRPG